jgi:hypothetical protein
MKRLALLPVAAAAAVLAVAGSSGSAAPQTSNSPRVTSFSVLEKETSFHIVDNPPAARREFDLSPGDLIIFTDDFFEGARKVGADNGLCIVTSRTVVECHGSVRFRKKGSIELQGAVPVARFEPGTSFTTAITGGTGAYRNVQGTARVSHLSETTDRITFRAIR